MGRLKSGCTAFHAFATASSGLLAVESTTTVSRSGSGAVITMPRASVTTDQPAGALNVAPPVVVSVVSAWRTTSAGAAGPGAAADAVSVGVGAGGAGGSATGVGLPPQAPRSKTGRRASVRMAGDGATFLGQRPRGAVWAGFPRGSPGAARRSFRRARRTCAARATPAASTRPRTLGTARRIRSTRAPPASPRRAPSPEPPSPGRPSWPVP